MGSLARWSAGSLVGWLVDLLVDSLFRWLVRCFLVGWLCSWLIRCFVGLLVSFFFCLLAGSFVGWLFGRW